MASPSPTRTLDIRWPIGLLFAAMGVALAAYGAAFAPRGSVEPTRVNLDLWWGFVLVIFGAAMIFGAWRADRRAASRGGPG